MIAEIHQHPPSAFSFDKSNSYSDLIKNDLHALVNTYGPQSPQYAIEAARDTVSAGSPLIETGLLAASKVCSDIRNAGRDRQGEARPPLTGEIF